MWQECSGAGQSFERHLKWCGLSSRAELTQFSVQPREVWLYLMDWDLLGRKLHSFLHPTSQSTSMVQFVLTKGTCFSDGCVLKIYCPSYPMSFCQCQWNDPGNANVAGTELGAQFYLKCWEMLKFLVATDKLDWMRPVCSGYANPLTAQSSNQKQLSLPPWLPGNLPPLISIWFLFLFLFHQYSVTHSAPCPVSLPLRRAGFVPLYETSASMWFGKEIKHLGLGNLWP